MRSGLVLLLLLPACRCVETAPSLDRGRSAAPPRLSSSRPAPVPGVGILPNMPRATAASWRWAVHREGSTRRDHPRRTEMHLVQQGKTVDTFFSIVDVNGEIAVVAIRGARDAVPPLWRHETRCRRALPSGKLDGALYVDALDDALYVVCFPVAGEGYQVHALQATTGTVRWMVEPRPLGRSKNEQAIQLDGQGQQVAVHCHNPVAPFVDLLDRATGRPTASDAPPPALTTIAWHAARSPRAAWPTLKLDHGHVEVRGQGGKVVVRKLDGKRPVWSTTLAVRPYGNQALIVPDEPAVKRLFLAIYCGGASGVELSGLDAATGRVLWRTSPYGVGPIGHSKYCNAVGIEVLLDHLVVFGDESGGHYVEALDLATGRSVATRRFYDD